MKVLVASAEEGTRWRSGAVEPLAAAHAELMPPRRHVGVFDEAGSLQARCSIWRGRDPYGNRSTEGRIGHFRAATAEAATVLLERACAELEADGHTRAYGPVDASIWKPLGLIVDRGPQPRFFLEPDHPDAYPEYFEGNGFSVAETYFSGTNDDLSVRDPRTAERLQALQSFGMNFRALRLEALETDLEELYEVAIVAFTGNSFYEPIDLETFRKIHETLVAPGPPELVQIAEMNGKAVGYAMGMPDRVTDGAPSTETMIMTAVATLPSYSGGGLAAVLGDLCHQAGERLGFTRAIHAYMPETSQTRALSAKFGAPLRRYAVWQRDLAGAVPSGE